MGGGGSMLDDLKGGGGGGSLLDDLKGGGFFDFGHPLLNRVAESFVKAAGIGAVQAVTREAFFASVDGASTCSDALGGEGKKHRLTAGYKGDNYKKTLEVVVKNTSKESFEWGLAAGVYSGLTYGLKEARGSHDWKNSAVAGAITGATLALASEGSSHERVVQYAITGAALSTAANLLTGVF